jgi:hypothetical protein
VRRDMSDLINALRKVGVSGRKVGCNCGAWGKLDGWRGSSYDIATRAPCGWWVQVSLRPCCWAGRLMLRSRGDDPVPVDLY